MLVSLPLRLGPCGALNLRMHVQLVPFAAAGDDSHICDRTLYQQPGHVDRAICQRAGAIVQVLAPYDISRVVLHDGLLPPHPHSLFRESCGFALSGQKWRNSLTRQTSTQATINNFMARHGRQRPLVAASSTRKVAETQRFHRIAKQPHACAVVGHAITHSSYRPAELRLAWAGGQNARAWLGLRRRRSPLDWGRPDVRNGRRRDRCAGWHADRRLRHHSGLRDHRRLTWADNVTAVCVRIDNRHRRAVETALFDRAAIRVDGLATLSHVPAACVCNKDDRHNR